MKRELITIGLVVVIGVGGSIFIQKNKSISTVKLETKVAKDTDISKDTDLSKIEAKKNDKKEIEDNQVYKETKEEVKEKEINKSTNKERTKNETLKELKIADINKSKQVEKLSTEKIIQPEVIEQPKQDELKVGVVSDNFKGYGPETPKIQTVDAIYAGSIDSNFAQFRINGLLEIFRVQRNSAEEIWGEGIDYPSAMKITCRFPSEEEMANARGAGPGYIHRVIVNYSIIK